MHLKPLIATVVTALALTSVATSARAENANDSSFSGNFKMDFIDRNKDKMVSKAEFMEAMGKVWDMKMKEMKVKGDKLDARQMQELLMYFRTGA